jgi:hypothetical protein
MAKDHIGRENAAKAGKREQIITQGAVETSVGGFQGSTIFGTPPFHPTYGNHKKMGSEMAPTVAGGRGGSGKPLLGKLNDVVFKAKGTGE